jgi:2'-5' RNA ligase
MEKELIHSFNIRLSPEVAQKLKLEQEKLSKRFTELRFYDASPHLSLGAKFMTESETDAFVQALAEEFKDDKAWELEFASFQPSDAQEGKYIFLTLTLESQRKLFNIHERAFGVTEEIGSEGMEGATKPKYPYHPHVSVIKVQTEEMPEALKLIKEDFSGVTMPVTHYEVTRQKEDEKGFSTFPVVLEINLK